ncbi:MAG TPA: hypothetical protein VH539_07530 [Gemmatimonadaceae bacterium]
MSTSAAYRYDTDSENPCGGTSRARDRRYVRAPSTLPNETGAPAPG